MHNLKKRLKRKKKDERFGALNSLHQEIKTLIEHIVIVSAPKFWISGIEKLWQDAQLLAVSFFFVLAAVLAILRRLRKKALGLTNLPVV